MGSFERYLEAKVKRLEIKKDAPEIIAEIQSAYLGAIEDHMLWMETKDNAPPNKVEGMPLHPEMAFELKTYFTDVVAGHRNKYFEPVSKGRGKLGRTPTELSCIGNAVRYHHYVKIGKIKDKHPVKTIHELYGGGKNLVKTHRTTVEGWLRDKQFDHLKCYDRDKTPHPNLVKRLLKFSGEYYTLNFATWAKNKRTPAP